LLNSCNKLDLDVPLSIKCIVVLVSKLEGIVYVCFNHILEMKWNNHILHAFILNITKLIYLRKLILYSFSFWTEDLFSFWFNIFCCCCVFKIVFSFLMFRHFNKLSTSGYYYYRYVHMFIIKLVLKSLLNFSVYFNG